MDSKLPDDINMEILSRTSLKTFDIMRCTSKEFHKLTYCSYLLDLYNQRNEVVYGLLVQNMRRNKYIIDRFVTSHESKGLDLDFLPTDARILASSEQGIILFESANPRNLRYVLYHVCKPTTKQVVPLPNPKTKYVTVKVAIVVMGSKPLHYKIVRLSQQQRSVLQRNGKLYSTYRCEIFDSTAWAWKLMDLVMLPFCVFPTYPEPITAMGSIYMLLTNNEVLKYDACSEKWTTFSSPIATLYYPDFPSYMYRTLVKYRGKLGFACRPANGCWEIWVLSTEESWKKIHVFNTNEGIGRERLEAVYDSDTSVMAIYNILKFYRFKSDKSIKTVVLRDMPFQIFVFRSDYEPTDLVGGQS